MATARVRLDFETRSECNIKTHGGFIYSKHPTTIPLLMAYAIDDGPVRLLDKGYWEDPEAEVPPELLELFATGDYVVVAHNAFFEQCIWNHILVPQYGWPAIPADKWIDTMAKALAFALPASLEYCAEALGLPVKKDLRGKQLINLLCVPQKITKNSPNKWNNDPQLFKEFGEYNVTDVVVCRSIDKKLPDLSPLEQQVWLEDQRMNMYGVPVDLQLAHSCIKLIAEYAKELNDELSHVTAGAVDKATKLKSVKEWLMLFDIEAPSLDKTAITRLLEQGVPPEVARVLWIRQQIGRSSTAKYKKFVDMTYTDNRTRSALVYCGATTGRWTGRGVQLHNLPKGKAKFGGLPRGEVTEALVELIKLEDLETMQMLFEDVSEVFSSAIRGAVVAEPGHELVVADYAQIEARIVMWYADEQDALDMFRSGKDIYIDMAERIYEKKGFTKDKNPRERDLGKSTILGAGFGMAWERFKAQAALDPYYLELTDDLAQAAVRAYRQTYKKVVKLWYDTEAAAKAAITENRTVECGKIKWGMRGSFLLCRLPSGRFLSYPYPKIMKKVYTAAQVEELTAKGQQWKIDKSVITFMTVESGQWRRVSTHGSSLVENFVQATARDIIANGLLNVKNHRALSGDTDD